jgi:predicted outer membrane protein
MNTSALILSVRFAAVLIATPALLATAQTATAPATSTGTSSSGAAAKPKPLAPADKKFFKDISDAMLVGQKLAGLSKNGSTNEVVKKLGETIDADIGKAWTPFATLSQEKAAELTQEVSKSDASNAAKLAKVESDKFDKEFLKDLSKETKKTGRLLDSAKSLQDPELKAWVETWGPTLKGHEALVQKVEKQIGKK